ncbi:hypothetical protein SDC9_163732 [bioreactor metagenome]|uniref:Uncharacterized protein n=1 Tax=bioreactor metagenome TaxID=1076179 RepID=A0A645FRZ5_9ZZZZ
MHQRGAVEFGDVELAAAQEETVGGRPGGVDQADRCAGEVEDLEVVGREGRHLLHDQRVVVEK